MLSATIMEKWKKKWMQRYSIINDFRLIKVIPRMKTSRGKKFTVDPGSINKLPEIESANVTTNNLISFSHGLKSALIQPK